MFNPLTYRLQISNRHFKVGTFDCHLSGRGGSEWEGLCLPMAAVIWHGSQTCNYRRVVISGCQCSDLGLAPPGGDPRDQHWADVLHPRGAETEAQLSKAADVGGASWKTWV